MNRIVIAGATVGFAANALAGTVVIDPEGGGPVLHSKDLSAFVFGGPSPGFTNSALKGIHDSINTTVSTDGFITIMVADTDMGLAIFALIDDEETGAAAGAVVLDSIVGFSATADGLNVEYINDVGDAIGVLPGDPKVAGGDFEWDANAGGAKHGDAFAWANLVAGDEGTFGFAAKTSGALDTANGITLGSSAIQFVSWEGGAWVQKDVTHLLANGNQEFSWLVIPLPAPAAMAMAGIGGLAFVRRRSL